MMAKHWFAQKNATKLSQMHVCKGVFANTCLQKRACKNVFAKTVLRTKHGVCKRCVAHARLQSLDGNRLHDAHRGQPSRRSACSANKVPEQKCKSGAASVFAKTVLQKRVCKNAFAKTGLQQKHKWFVQEMCCTCTCAISCLQSPARCASRTAFAQKRMLCKQNART